MKRLPIGIVIVVVLAAVVWITYLSMP